MGTATVPLCQHWMDNATRCGSPAMRGTRYCYSHHLERGAREKTQSARGSDGLNPRRWRMRRPCSAL